MNKSPVDRLHTDCFPTGKKILYCVLNWGLGHATRSIPIIEALIQRSNQITIASDGLPLDLLRQHFPDLNFEVLPSYKITYPRPDILQNMLLQAFQIRYAMRKEHKTVTQLNDIHKYDWVISDNRPGCFDARSMCVYITHQTEPFHKWSWVRQIFKRVSRFYFRPFQQIWIPDENNQQYSGILSNRSFDTPPVHFIGLCSSTHDTLAQRDSSIAIILSGPEPQRSLLENKLWAIAIAMKDRQFIWVRGSQKGRAMKETPPNIKVTDVASSAEINQLLNTCEMVICRSGYSSVMDLAASDCKALLIPTPGQSEQEYLAEYHTSRWPWVNQDTLSERDIRTALTDQKS
ncbi:MAG: glycosyltransferase family protein [Saprospiraceae bacterium]